MSAKRSRTFPANFESLDALRAFVGQAAREAGMDDSEVYAIQLAVDEACSNIIEHAYGGQDRGEIECSCEVTDQALSITLRDHGQPFDLDLVVAPDLSTGLDERQIGGLGVFLMRRLMDEVRFESQGQAGNVLTLVKRHHITGPNPASPWSSMIRLGEDLLRTPSLARQGEQIIQAAERLFNAQANLWIDERWFRLPGQEHKPTFPPAPPQGPLRRAIESGQPCCSEEEAPLWAAVPLLNQNVILGALEIRKPQGPPLSQTEIDLLAGLAGHISLAIYTGHRVAVEQWRLEQLDLVRKVSAQLARLSEVEELASRITHLIQETYQYYYVALFTYEAAEKRLRLRSSAPPGRSLVTGKRRKTPLNIRLGEGLIGLAAQLGREILANDVRIEPRFRYVDGLPETRAEVVLPLKVEDRLLGVLDVQSDRLNAFHPNDLLVLRALADTIAVALEGGRLYGALEKRARQLALVAEVGNEIASIQEPDKLLGRVASLIQERLKFPYVHLFTVHPNRRQIIYEAGSGARSEHHISGYVLSLDSSEGLIPWVARHGQTALVNDVSRDPRYRPSPIPPEDTRAELTVPLIYEGRVVGILDVQSDRKNAFDDDDRFLCEALADNIAVAIHNADLYRTERWRRRVAEGLREVAGLLSAQIGLDDVLDAILNELERNLPSQVSAIWLVEGGELSLARIHGAEAAEVEEATRRWPEARAFLLSALDSLEPSIRRPTDPIGPTGAALGYTADYSSIAAALRIGDQAVGVLTLSHPTPGRYGHEAQAITATFASYAAVAIENARLYDAAQEQAYASAALLQIAQTVATASTLDEVLTSITRMLPILVGVEACGSYLWEEGRFCPAQAYGFPAEVEALLMEREFSPGEFPLLDAAREKEQMVAGLLTAEAPTDWLRPELPRSSEEAHYLLTQGEHLLMAFPMLIKGVLYGVLLIKEGNAATRFRNKRIEIITSVAQEVALSIQNEHLLQQMRDRERLEHEMQLARRIQQTFLPERLPQLPGWELAAAWETAREVGGDFYDIIELPQGRLGLLIADVSDKGMPAALFMALTRTLVRAAVSDLSSPAEVLRRVNDLIFPDNRQGMFVTAVYAVLSPQRAEVWYANAGHTPPCWLHRENHQVELLSRTGMALGVVESLEIGEGTLLLSPGDLLLFYTDGLTEAFSPQGDLFGVDRLIGVLKSQAGATASGLLTVMRQAVRQFTEDTPLLDDMTLLALRRIPPGNEPRQA